MTAGLILQPSNTCWTCLLLKLDSPMERTSPSSTHFSIALQVSRWSTLLNMQFLSASCGNRLPVFCTTIKSSINHFKMRNLIFNRFLQQNQLASGSNIDPSIPSPTTPVSSSKQVQLLRGYGSSSTTWNEIQRDNIVMIVLS